MIPERHLSSLSEGQQRRLERYLELRREDAPPEVQQAAWRKLSRPARRIARAVPTADAMARALLRRIPPRM